MDTIKNQAQAHNKLKTNSAHTQSTRTPATGPLPLTPTSALPPTNFTSEVPRQRGPSTTNSASLSSLLMHAAARVLRRAATPDCCFSEATLDKVSATAWMTGRPKAAVLPLRKCHRLLCLRHPIQTCQSQLHPSRHLLQE
jgi:hypothetical protein